MNNQNRENGPGLDEQLQRLDQGWQAYRLRSGAVLSDEQATYVYNFAKHLTIIRETRDDGEIMRRGALDWDRLWDMKGRLNMTGRQLAGIDKRAELLYSIACGDREPDNLPPGISPKKQPRLSFSVFGHRVAIW